MHYARLKGTKTMTLEARVSNVIARSLYKKLGFLEGGIRKNYYSDNQEDAIVMWVKL
jgi:ribosomal-protein-alanine N-acetyltransferase